MKRYNPNDLPRVRYVFAIEDSKHGWLLLKSLIAPLESFDDAKAFLETWLKKYPDDRTHHIVKETVTHEIVTK